MSSARLKAPRPAPAVSHCKDSLSQQLWTQLNPHIYKTLDAHTQHGFEVGILNAPADFLSVR